MNLLGKIKSKFIYKEVIPLILNEQLRDAYQTASVTGGTLKGKTALITGATSGIGLAIAERFINEGCNVIISGRNQEKLGIAKKELVRRSHLRDNSYIECVMMDQYNASLIRETLHELFSSYHIDIIINNAGVFGEKDKKRAFRSVTCKEYFKTIDINLKSAILIGQLSAQYLANKGGGNILNISSICSFSQNYYYTPYGISKTGIVSFTKMLAEKYKTQNVFVNSIAPGSVATIMSNHKLDDNISSFHPLHHIIFPEQIAALAAFMVCDICKYIKYGEVISACATEQV